MDDLRPVSSVVVQFPAVHLPDLPRAQPDQDGRHAQGQAWLPVRERPMLRLSPTAMRAIRVITLGVAALAAGARVSPAQTAVPERAVAATQPSVSWTTVTYLSGQQVYVDAGTANGLREGSRLEVVRSGSVIATIVVAFISSTKSSCTVES